MRQRRKAHSAVAKILFFVVGVAALYGSYYLGNQHALVKPRFLNLRELDRPQAIDNIVLRDQHGNSFDKQRLFGYWNLVLFGYTGAAESARDRLTLITQVKNRLAIYPEIQQITRALFISADPDIDEPKLLKTFMAQFSPDYLALTGSTDGIQSIAQLLGVTIRRLPTSDKNGYRVDHSSTIFLIGPDANLIGLFTGVVDAASIAADIRQLTLDQAE